MMARFTTLTCIVLLSTLLPAISVLASEEDHVLVLTNENFSTKIKDHAYMLVEFYAPWCGHCKKLAPEYTKAAAALKQKSSEIILAKVDATAETEVADRHSVKGYPTLLFFRNGVSEEYSGGRTSDTIVEWLEKMTGPAVVKLEGSLEERMKADGIKVAFLGSFKSEDHERAKMFTGAADSSRQLGKCFLTISSSADDSISVVRHDEEPEKFEGTDEEALKTWMAEASFPLLGPINGENYRNYAGRSQELVWLCGTDLHLQDYQQAVRDAAKLHRAELSFVWLNTTAFAGHAENALGVSEFPALVYQSKNGRYVIPDPTTNLKSSKAIIDFFADVKSGKIEKVLKSEEIPEKNDDDVKVVVGKTFEDIVLQKEKDVMLEVYAPWCGHCKKLEPIYKQFAEQLKSVEHVVVAKLDGTANESPVEGFEWHGFPTIFFVKAGEKTPIKFDAERTVEGMMEFVKKHSSKAVDVEVPPADKGEEL